MDHSKLRWLRPGIVLSAAAIVCITDIVNGSYRYDATKPLLRLLGVIILFTIIGTVVTKIIDHAINAPSKDQQEPEDIQLDDEDEDESAE